MRNYARRNYVDVTAFPPGPQAVPRMPHDMMRRLSRRFMWAAKTFLLSALCVVAAGGQTSETCAACHRSIWETYRRTGMGRSFYRPSPENTVANESHTFYHQPSDSYFTMLRRDGKFYQRRHQIDPEGREI